MPVVENAWRTVRFEPAEIVEPESVEDVQRIVREAAAAGRKVKAVGGRHSMNHVFRTAGVLVDLRRMNRILSVDRETGEVEVEGGLQLGDAIAALDAEGLHLPSLGSWHTQSLAGAVATSTHGSSMTHGSFSDIVTEMEAVLGDGSVRRFGDGDALRAMRCSLGRLGIVTKLKLRLTPAFMLHCEIESGPADAAFAEATERARADEWVN
ncbi:MAG TPA: FAD-dependent oxidoreductase, partial [Paracoccaceae bacterium]|nr:FAD-dependent oxidoreductase [Paracoccaceae bacterium]